MTNIYKMKKMTRLTESDLHRIIKESVNRILREEWESPLEKAKKNRNDFDNVKKIDLSKFEKKSKKPKAGTFGDLPSFAKLKNIKNEAYDPSLDEGNINRIVKESIKRMLKEYGSYKGMISPNDRTSNSSNAGTSNNTRISNGYNKGIYDDSVGDDLRASRGVMPNSLIHDDGDAAALRFGRSRFGRRW